MKRTKSQFGKLARTKGANFERLIARMLREKFPAAEVFRSQQADRAHDPDIVIRGTGTFLDRSWPELTCGKAVTWGLVQRKMSQAVRDIERASSKRAPIVIWRRQGERNIFATFRDASHFYKMITIELGDLIDKEKMLDEARLWSE